MASYIGVRCPVCSKKFATADDIVVCPVCGAPHHRHCYIEKGECVFAAEHLSGKEWQAPQEAAQAGEGAAAQQCPGCGASNPAESLFCQVCGTRLGAGAGTGTGMPTGAQPRAQGYSASGGWGFSTYGVHIDAETFRYGGVAPDSTINGEQARDLAVFVGNNTAYYLPRFQMFSDGTAAFSLNVAALFFNFFYFFYRKMYLIGAVLLGLFGIVIVPYILYIREMLPEIILDPSFAPVMEMMDAWGYAFKPEVLSGVVNQEAASFYLRIFSTLRYISLAVSIAVGCFANMLYYRKCVREVRKARETLGENPDPARFSSVLSYKGGVSNGMIVLSAFLVFGIYVALYSIIVFNGSMIIP